MPRLSGRKFLKQELALNLSLKNPRLKIITMAQTKEEIDRISQELISSGVVFGINNLTDHESCVTLQLKIIAITDGLAKFFKIPKLKGYKFEYKVSVGRIDLIMFHLDGGVTIVEAKGNTDVRAIASGIGQIFMYESVIRDNFRENKKPVYVNRILCAPIDDMDKFSKIEKTCNLARVNFVGMSSFKRMKKMVNKLIAKQEAINGSSV